MNFNTAKTKDLKEYFIKKFEAIPEDRWFTGDYHNDDKSAFCAAGHCGEFWHHPTAESHALDRILEANLADINDGYDKYLHLGLTPKQRILNALKQIKV